MEGKGKMKMKHEGREGKEMFRHNKVEKAGGGRKMETTQVQIGCRMAPESSGRGAPVKKKRRLHK